MKWDNVALFAVVVSCLAVASVTLTWACCSPAPYVAQPPFFLGPRDVSDGGDAR